MKHVLLSLVLVAACDPGPDLDLDIDLGPGPIAGERGAVTFSFVDGCTGSQPLWGCPKIMPTLAVGSQMRLVAGSVSGEAADERRLARAKATSLDQGVASASRDEGGLLVIDAIAPGVTTVELVDDGEVIDELSIHIEPIARLQTDTSSPAPTVLVGSRFAAPVDAFGPSGSRLYAHGAIGAQTFDGLELDTEATGFFTASDQFVVRSNTPGDVRIEFFVERASAESSFRIATRAEITEISVSDLFADPTSNKGRLEATPKIDGVAVRGGPACDWQVVSGNAVLTSAVGDNINNPLFVIYDSAIVYGNGEVVVECRANERVVAQHTLQLAP